ncbi:endonuclease/exonuclease/phosphatase family protein [Niameybacter massiliensis]|uniref:endonuclease/exonuclease/phosphatase family protein n=1 Tax=Niameybacter massiliensis TaxID=1658108 RepID=UPI0006B419F5|nr:endonuclease/exonuclease/phosphatase family protein [Niameybacter massiliensis]
MKFVTFNIRCDYNQDDNNSFCYRKPYILGKLKNESPDIICFQEILPHVATWLKENLTDYYVLGCGRDENLEDEQITIAFKKMQYQMISMNTFWLSEAPQVPGSRYEKQSMCPRTCTEMVLQDIETKEILRVFNTHLDHEGSEARVLGMTQILTYIQQITLFKDATIILTGDFNAYSSDPEVTMISEVGKLVDLTSDLEGTYHDFGRVKENEKIDYIFSSPHVVCEEKGLWTDEYNGVFLSDHYPVFVEMTTK